MKFVSPQFTHETRVGLTSFVFCAVHHATSRERAMSRLFAIQTLLLLLLHAVGGLQLHAEGLRLEASPRLVVRPTRTTMLAGMTTTRRAALATAAALLIPSLPAPANAEGVVPATAGGTDDGACRSESNPAVTTVICTRYGANADGRLKGCSALENCVSSSAVRSPSKFLAPWTYGEVSRLRDEPARAWLQLTRAVEAVGGDGVVTVSRDDEARYLHVTAPSLVPPGSLDDLEFRLDETARAVFVRSATRTSIFVYPLQRPLGDKDSNRGRLNRIRDELAWGDVGYQPEADGERGYPTKPY